MAFVAGEIRRNAMLYEVLPYHELHVTDCNGACRDTKNARSVFSATTVDQSDIKA
jgi:hypothetical protein